MFAKMVLPLLGGTPQVWNTCMVFFQAALLLGYVYTHLSIHYLGVRRQVWLQIALLALPFAVLPIALDPDLVPPAEGYPAIWLLGVLTITLGLPFVIVASYGPMLQKWFSGLSHRHAGDPYFLYAASNAGSMGALLAYPFFLEPLLTLELQSRLWTSGYVLLLILTIACVFYLVKQGVGNGEDADISIGDSNDPIGLTRRLRWIALAFVPSSMMLGVTNYISTDIAAVPLLWVVPLALYLLSFILVFARRTLLPHEFFVRALPLAAMVLALLLASRMIDPMPVMVSIHLTVFFIVAMVCHGELAKDRPPVSRLTEFYLLLSVGGVLGGIFNALISPLLFNDIYEYPIALFLALLLSPALVTGGSVAKPGLARYALLVIPAVLVLVIDASLNPVMASLGVNATSLGPLRLLAVIILPLFVVYFLAGRSIPFAVALGGWFIASMVLFEHTKGDVYLKERSYFGVHEVSVTPKLGDAWVLRNGVTVHGVQQREPSLRRIPGTYYHPTGPAGQVMGKLQSQPGNTGIVGLGAGALASYTEAGDQVDFFEIDPVVARIAEDSRYFTYLSDARERGVVTNIHLGDARLVLKTQPDNKFDLLVIDAFSSDAIPVHLATREAVQLYLNKINDKGLLLFHVSNHYLEMRPMLCNIADELSQHCYYQENAVKTREEQQQAKTYSIWLLMGEPGALRKVLSPEWQRLTGNGDQPVWRDDYSNIFQLLK
jgi:hypothetical protein